MGMSRYHVHILPLFLGPTPQENNHPLMGEGVVMVLYYGLMYVCVCVCDEITSHLASHLASNSIFFIPNFPKFSEKNPEAPN